MRHILLFEPGQTQAEHDDERRRDFLTTELEGSTARLVEQRNIYALECVLADHNPEYPEGIDGPVIDQYLKDLRDAILTTAAETDTDEVSDMAKAAIAAEATFPRRKT